MKPWAAWLGLCGIACGALGAAWQDHSTTLIVTGDLQGHLEPCGCTTPQTGGILRLATLVKALRSKQDVVLLANGAMVNDVGKRDEIKAETIAQAYEEMGVGAINLAEEDARLGIGGIYAIQNSSNSRLVCGCVTPTPSLPLKDTRQEGPFLIGGASTRSRQIASDLGSQEIGLDQAVEKLISDAKGLDLAPVLMLDGSVSDADRVARKFPQLGLIVYRSPDNVPSAPRTIGNSMLVTAGEGGKGVVRINYDGSSFGVYQAIPLGPDFKDDPKVARFYAEYLKRVDQGGFLDRLPRSPSAAFAGSLACLACHKQAYDVWAHSRHAQAFASLESKGHARDPDCVGCHVVGLNAVGGFHSRALNRNLANVGCESCHGAAKRHVQHPHAFKLPTVKLGACLSCHTSEQSPNFNPLTSWPKIRHR